MATYKNPIPSLDFPIKKRDVVLEENEYTAIESVYFAFIDVLGFKKAFDDDRLANTGEPPEKFKNIFKYYFALMNSAEFTKPEKTFYYAGQTSDSLYFYTESVDILIEFFKIFSYFNVYAMTQDIFFRGGIAKGRLFYKEKYQFYGDSVINAYLLESEISKNPIITIDENTYNDISNKDDSKNLIDITKSGRHYIKPFAYLEHKFNLSLSEPSVEIKEIDEKLLQSTIKRNIIKFEYDERNYGKYVYLLKEYEEYLNKKKIK